jgi:TP901 family phage tail tape measure protein
MANNLALGIVIGATVSGSVARAFDTLDQRATHLGHTLQQVRRDRVAGTAAGDDVSNLIRQEERLAGSLMRTNTLRRNAATRSNLGGQVLGTVGAAVGAAYAIAQPLRQALNFEHELQLFGNIVAFNNTQLGNTKTQLNTIASATNQTPGELLAALNTLASKGLDPSRALASLDIIGKTATATGADVNELARTSFTLIDAMGLAPNELPKAMDLLAQAGKMGSFELKDMATYFPQLTAQAKSLGITGTQGIATMGAALQIAMKGASDPAQAANNFQNFLTKLTSKETVKNFEKMGVNVEKVMTEASAKGLDPVVTMVEKIQELTGGNKFKMSELFSDMQVLGFLNPMIANLDEFNRIKKESLAANGVINRDYEAMMATGTEQLKKASIEGQKLSMTIGASLGPALNDIVAKLTPIVREFGLWAEKNKPLIATVIELTGAFIGLKLGFAVGKYLKTFVSDIWTMGEGLYAFATSEKIVTAAQWLWNASLFGCPLVWIIGAVVALGAAVYLVYKNWEPIKAFFATVWSDLLSGVQGVGTAISGAFSAMAATVQGIWGGFTSWFSGTFPAMAAAASSIGATISGAFSAMAATVRGIWESLINWLSEKFAQIGAMANNLITTARTIGDTVASIGRLATTPMWGASKAAVIGTAVAVGGAMPAGATPLPPMSTGKQPQSVMYNNNNTFHITQNAGEDSKDLAKRMIKEYENKQAADKRGRLHD